MLPTSTRIYSADDHIIEPPNTWVERVPAKYRDDCPRIVEIGGRQAWLYEGEHTHIMMGSCRPLPGVPETGLPHAKGTANFDEIRPGCFDPAKRLKDMDLDGVWGQLCFPNYARFAGHRFFGTVRDVDLALACLRAYNDFLLEEWCAAAPDRLFGAAILPLHDIDAAVREFERVAEKGAAAIAFSENPTVLGLPSIHTQHWQPLWSAMVAAGIPVCTHIGSSSRLLSTSGDAPPTVQVTLLGLNSMMAATDWFFSGVLEANPKLEVMLSEGGAGWLPYMLERADKVFHDKRLQGSAPAMSARSGGSSPPSQLFREHMYVCLVDEHFAIDSLASIPVDNLLFEGDYPHGDGLWPNSRAYLDKVLAEVPDEDAEKIAGSNLRRLLKR
jgi:predicted TIM-barrel fold metal-dependent hydrolase